VRNAALTSNDASQLGGGAAIVSGAATFVDTTFYGNESLFDGGGLSQESGTSVRLHDTTFSSNSAARHGGALFAGDGRRIHLASSTVADNEADGDASGDGRGGGIYIAPCTQMACATDYVFLRNSIVADNQVGNASGTEDCSGLLTSNGYNLVEAANTGTTGPCRVDGNLAGVLVQTDPLLGPADDNGGIPVAPGGLPPETHALLVGSPAIAHGDPAGCTDTLGELLRRDERGALRIGRCDLGAYERDGIPLLFADGFESGDPSGWWTP